MTEEQKEWIKECVSYGYQNCLNDKGDCAKYSFDCAKQCSTNYECYSNQCCQNNFCMDDSKCPPSSDSYSGSSNLDPNIIMAIVVPISIFIVLLIFCICYQNWKRKLKLRQQNNTIVQNPQNLNMNQQMMLSNNISMQMQQNQLQGNIYQNQIPQGIINGSTAYPPQGIYNNQGQGIQGPVLLQQQYQQQQQNNGLVSYL